MKLSDKILHLLVGLSATAALSSCENVFEDLQECAPDPQTYTTVSFVYDYNMDKKDLFTEHVGSVYLYVFDSKGIYRMRRSLHRADMDKVDFSMRFNESEFEPGQTYQFVAIASGNPAGYSAALETPGFTLQTEMIPGVSTIDDYVLKLDRDNNGEADFGVVDYRDAYGNNQQMMDTIWTTRPDEVQIVHIPEREVYPPSPVARPDRELPPVTIPMMRITNSVKVNLVSRSFDANTSADAYHVLVRFPYGNGTIDFTGNTLPAQELYYRALRKDMIAYKPTRAGEDDDDTRYALHSEFGLSRLQVADGSSLQVRDAQTNEIIAEIENFSDFLAEFFEHDEDDQEFLDREYDFEIDFEIDDDCNFKWIALTLNVLGWHKIVYFTDL